MKAIFPATCTPLMIGPQASVGLAAPVLVMASSPLKPALGKAGPKSAAADGMNCEEELGNSAVRRNPLIRNCAAIFCVKPAVVNAPVHTRFGSFFEDVTRWAEVKSSQALS